jgi:hypothetical protein
MKTANFICPFDQETRVTQLPEGVDSWWHLSMENGEQVIVQVRAEDEIIDNMKVDTDYVWLEDILAEGVETQGSPRAPVLMGGKSNEEPIEVTTEDIVTSFRQTMEGYRGSGLG